MYRLPKRSKADLRHPPLAATRSGRKAAAAEALVISVETGIMQILDAFLGSEKAKKVG